MPLAEREVTVAVKDLNEKPYVDITLWWLERMGIKYGRSDDYSEFWVAGGQSYDPIDVSIPGDFSSATFPAVAAALTGSTITLTGLDLSDPQGDKRVLDIVEALGARVARESSGVSVSGANLTGMDIDLNPNPDALPALSVLATAASGTTRIGNVPQARIKETDRIAVMAQELAKLGAQVTEESDALVVRQSDLTGAVVQGHGDHRVVMALALAGMVARGETIIEGAEAAEITYPSFREDFVNLGADIEEIA
jgi:3-phosphoshikimate 1-carboxyvinyltransferase